uniref:Neogenin_C domain-containing protein n=1 Tax=Heterorhabditis bacteriophora TaxID=37862 RepID=A0A1I7X3L5_HETBA
MCAGDSVWTYNSMKTSHTGSMGILMYSGNRSHSGSRVFHQTTPATLRSYIGAPLEPAPLRHSASTTLRLQPAEHSVAYHSVGRHAIPSTEYYEEIPPRGLSPHIQSISKNPKPSHGRMSIRKPPPTCRPPPPPREYSPGGSDCSIEKELSRFVD